MHAESAKREHGQKSPMVASVSAERRVGCKVPSVASLAYVYAWAYAYASLSGVVCPGLSSQLPGQFIDLLVAVIPEVQGEYLPLQRQFQQHLI